jgi:hypothetical protein
LEFEHSGQISITKVEVDMSERRHGLGSPSEAEIIRRREFLFYSVSLFALAVAGASVVDSATSAALAAAPTQDNWGHCGNCNMLFYNGSQSKGRCAAYGVPAKNPHVAAKLGGTVKKYQVTYDDSTGNGQGDWRFCNKCSVLFFNGYPDKGVCAADKGGHVAAGWSFFLYHERLPTLNEEDGWRYCANCHALFTTRFPNTAGCPANGKGHGAAGYKFVVGRKGAASTL